MGLLSSIQLVAASLWDITQLTMRTGCLNRTLWRLQPFTMAALSRTIGQMQSLSLLIWSISSYLCLQMVSKMLSAGRTSNLSASSGRGALKEECSDLTRRQLVALGRVCHCFYANSNHVTGIVCKQTVQFSHH